MHLDLFSATTVGRKQVKPRFTTTSRAITSVKINGRKKTEKTYINLKPNLFAIAKFEENLENIGQKLSNCPKEPKYSCMAFRI